MNNYDYIEPRENPPSDEDPASEATITWTAKYIVKEILKRGEQTLRTEATAQLNLESRDEAGAPVVVALYVYIDHPEDLICKATVDSDFEDLKICKETEYLFFLHDEVTVEKYVHYIDAAEAEARFQDYLKKDPEINMQRVEEYEREQIARKEAHDQAREMGLNRVTQQDMERLEQLIRTGK